MFTYVWDTQWLSYEAMRLEWRICLKKYNWNIEVHQLFDGRSER
jgi:hypothetical protein